MRTFVPIFLILISFGLFFVFINPQYREIQELMKQRREYKTALADIESIKLSRDALETQAANLPQSDMDRLEKLLPYKFNSVKLAADLDSIASRFSISIRDFVVDDVSVDPNSKIGTDKKPYETSTITFNAVGNFTNYVNFLKEIETSLGLIDVKKMNMKAGEKGGLMEFGTTINTYWIK